MATHKAKVIGPFEVGGVAPGGTVELDDEVVNVTALRQSQLVELILDEPKPVKKATASKRTAGKGDD